MRLLTRMLIATILMMPLVSQAALVWSSCQTVTGVSNQLAYDNGVFLAFSGSGISGCSDGTPGGIAFLVGQEGVTSTNITTILATSLTAVSSGRQVMIYYDTSNSCYSQIIAVGGYAGQCP